MTLLDRDGKPYRTISEPNPLLIGQESLEKSDLTLHNFKTKTKTDKNVPKPVIRKPEPTVAKTESVSAEDFVALLKKEAAELKKTEPPKPKNIMENEATVIVHCHPAVIREKKDEFYSETRKTIQYGKKFVFEALLVDSTDLEICLFTLDPTLTAGSVIYPSRYKYNNKKLESYRWWRLSKTQKYKDGFLVYGEITDYQADFSD